MNPNIEQVKDFWNQNPCNSRLSDAADPRQRYTEIESERYKWEPHIRSVVRAADFTGKKVLEIGCGVGTDGRQFAMAGAEYVGINLDEGSTKEASEAFRAFGLPGIILQANAETMQLGERFDHIYSFGVIHHTEHPSFIAANMHRHLKDGGTFTVMLYNRASVNYWLEIMFLRKLMRYALYPSWAPSLFSKLGISRQKLEKHREIMLQGSVSHDRWVSMNTDGPECPLARVYSAREATELFRQAGFRQVRTYCRFWDTRHYGKLSKLIPGGLVSLVANRWGWHRMIEGVK